MEVKYDWMSWMSVLLHSLILFAASCSGQIRCDCNTAECKDAGKTICVGTKSCYTELFQNTLNRGCDPAPLACENRKPAGVEVEWPAVYCCHHKDLCNKHAIPTVTTPDTEHETNGQKHLETKHPRFNCSNIDPQQRPHTKIINPIYIAVPIAGVCVLLALIIFAMYLLRRRTDFHHHDNFHHYHHDPGAVLTQKQAAVPHHCQCTCKKMTAPPCSKGNRCTDSERSSSGSETKLFLQS